MLPRQGSPSDWLVPVPWSKGMAGCKQQRDAVAGSDHPDFPMYRQLEIANSYVPIDGAAQIFAGL